MVGWVFAPGGELLTALFKSIAEKKQEKTVNCTQYVGAHRSPIEKMWSFPKGWIGGSDIPPTSVHGLLRAKQYSITELIKEKEQHFPIFWHRSMYPATVERTFCAHWLEIQVRLNAGKVTIDLKFYYPAIVVLQLYLGQHAWKLSIGTLCCLSFVSFQWNPS